VDVQPGGLGPCAAPQDVEQGFGGFEAQGLRRCGVVGQCRAGSDGGGRRSPGPVALPKLALNGRDHVAERVGLGEQLIWRADMESVPGPDDQLHPLEASEAQVALQVQGLDGFGPRRRLDLLDSAVAAEFVQELLDDFLHTLLNRNTVDA
jgi:hypothetical protein